MAVEIQIAAARVVDNLLPGAGDFDAAVVAHPARYAHQSLLIRGIEVRLADLRHSRRIARPRLNSTINIIFSITLIIHVHLYEVCAARVVNKPSVNHPK